MALGLEVTGRMPLRAWEMGAATPPHPHPRLWLSALRNLPISKLLGPRAQKPSGKCQLIAQRAEPRLSGPMMLDREAGVLASGEATWKLPSKRETTPHRFSCTHVQRSLSRSQARQETGRTRTKNQTSQRNPARRHWEWGHQTSIFKE